MAKIEVHIPLGSNRDCQLGIIQEHLRTLGRVAIVAKIPEDKVVFLGDVEARRGVEQMRKRYISSCVGCSISDLSIEVDTVASIGRSRCAVESDVSSDEGEVDIGGGVGRPVSSSIEVNFKGFLLLRRVYSEGYVKH